MKQPRIAATVVLTAALLWLNSAALAAKIRVGVAANFTSTLRQIAADFERLSGHRVVLSSGSTGKLFAQIKHGAPLDLLFAADVDRPARLEQEGDGVPGTRVTYAVGRLVLWSPAPDRINAAREVLSSGKFGKLAIANPATAPYGLAAKQVMQRLEVWQALQSQLVRGENIAQTFQFVASGNADLGFVALSQLRALGVHDGSSWVVPEQLHQPIEQQAVLLRNAREPAAAREFLVYVSGPEVQRLLQHVGYGMPSG